MIQGPKTVLLADDDAAVRWLYEIGLPSHLPGYRFATVRNGQEAIDYLNSQPVAVLITDVAMPVKDGFEVMAYVRNHHPNLPVIVIATVAPSPGNEEVRGLGAIHVLQKPVPPEVLAARILEVHGESARGRMVGLSLGMLLQLVQMERKSCSLHVRSGDSRGRLHFLSGELVNAYAFELDAEGEAAARYLLALDDVTVEFERSLHNHVRTIHTPLTTLLLDVAKEIDERGRPPITTGEGTRADDARAADAPSPSTETIGHRAAPGQLAVTATEAPPSAVAPPRVGAGVGGRNTGSAALGAAVEDLQEALPRLRQRTERTLQLLDEATPAMLEGARAVAAAGAHGFPSVVAEARMAAAWEQVNELANRLLRAAEELAPTDPTEG